MRSGYNNKIEVLSGFPKSEIDTNWRNKYAGLIAFKINNPTEEDIITIPLVMNIDIRNTGADVDHSFRINLVIDYSNLGQEIPNDPFEDYVEDIMGYVPGATTDSGMSVLSGKASVIMSTITTIGIIVSVVMCAVLGVKYMIGSVEERADYKKDIIPYLVGACLLFGISLFIKILQAMGNSINSI